MQYIIKLLFNYLKIPNCLNIELNIKCREFQLILQMIAVEINLQGECLHHEIQIAIRPW